MQNRRVGENFGVFCLKRIESHTAIKVLQKQRPLGRVHHRRDGLGLDGEIFLLLLHLYVRHVLFELAAGLHDLDRRVGRAERNRRRAAR